ncbi:MAG: UvrD-helicase domain-containing protein, partial [Myxococcales bacterium]
VRRIAGGTFHHVAHSLLREHSQLLGYGERYTLLDREDAQDLMGKCISELDLAVGARRFPRAEVMLDLVSTAMNTQKPLADVLGEKRPQFLPIVDDVLRVASRFVVRKQEMQVMDFDDLLMNWKVLLAEHPDVRRRLQERFKAILVDEYQDTNR